MVIILALLFLLLSSTPAHAAVWGAECQQQGAATLLGIKCVLTNVIQWLAPLILLAAVFMVILGGLRFVLAGNDPKKFAAGKQTLTYAIVGIIGLGLAWILLVIIEQLTGAPVTQIK
ncbi:hypothetical protein A2368_01565 [Candidatus Collierbacteria bacterium RIFOXYB1_FULL_49_13]|uniref:Uncharacterized protein n=1 Tax=Candidatus Collierbacteria bacterium RIFOXYB1_FULL_49_13 TaxID=1817728 RepID=A0A1F5FFW6_9BACT|nr:MAG: hypothetical protein A2368_01565 [Candidatus Collierbacteria bacterium RIFOXYB1_FULL_49_13]